MPFSELLENGYIQPGKTLLFRKDEKRTAIVKPNAKLMSADGFEGSIHQTGRRYMNGSPCNGWDHWYLNENGQMLNLDVIRQRFRADNKNND